MGMTVRGINGETYTINDADHDGHITQDEVGLNAGEKDWGDTALMKTLMEGQSYIDGAAWEFKDVIDHAGTPALKGTPDYKNKLLQLQAKHKVLAQELKKLKDLQAKQASGASLTLDETAQLAKLPTALSLTKSLLEAIHAQLKNAAATDDADLPEGLKAYLASFETANPEFAKKDAGGEKGTIKAALTLGDTDPSGSEGKAAGKSAGGTGTPGGGFGFPFGGGPGFKAALDPSALYQSSIFNDNRLAALDAIGEDQAKSQKMVALFLYFAQRAMTGIEGMVEFTRFIGWIIGRDKSKQTVQMASKLMELQDASRTALNEMLNAKAYDPNDQAVSAEFSKIMERSKADQSAIATDQKLMGQMIEDYAQVIEALTGMQRSMQDAKGRVDNMASRPA